VSARAPIEPQWGDVVSLPECACFVEDETRVASHRRRKIGGLLLAAHGIAAQEQARGRQPLDIDGHARNLAPRFRQLVASEESVEARTIHFWRQQVAMAGQNVEFLIRVEIIFGPCLPDQFPPRVGNPVAINASPRRTLPGPVWGARSPNQAITVCGSIVGRIASSARASNLLRAGQPGLS